VNFQPMQRRGSESRFAQCILRIRRIRCTFGLHQCDKPQSFAKLSATRGSASGRCLIAACNAKSPPQLSATKFAILDSIRRKEAGP